jgi:hypothetical protein
MSATTVVRTLLEQAGTWRLGVYPLLLVIVSIVPSWLSSAGYHLVAVGLTLVIVLVGGMLLVFDLFDLLAGS